MLCLQVLAQSPICQGCEHELLLVFSWQSEGVQLAESKVGSFTGAVKKAGSKGLPLLFSGAVFCCGLPLAPQPCNSCSAPSPGPPAVWPWPGPSGWASWLSLASAPALQPCWGIARMCLTMSVISGPDPDSCNVVSKASAPIWLAVTLSSQLALLCTAARHCCTLI